MKKDHSYNEESESQFAICKRQIINRADGTPYINRLIIIRCFLGSIMFHKIYSTDSDCMHDHPWAFITFILKGGYYEQTPLLSPMNIPIKNGRDKEVWYRPGTILYRPANWVHRLRITKAAWTLVFTGPEKRIWGFWTPRGWLKSKDYTNVGSCK